LEICKVSKNKKYLLTVVLALLVIIISGIRWKTGTDWNPYFNLFNNNQTFTDFFSVLYEPGFLLVNGIVKHLSSDYTLLLFTIATIVIAVKYYAISVLSPFPLVSILINISFYAGDLFTVRQGIAIAFVAYSCVFITRKQFVYFVFTSFIAMSFHVTAIVFLPAYYIFHLEFNNRKIIMWLILSFIFSLVINVGELFIYLSTVIFPFAGDKIARLMVMDINVASDIPLWLRQTLGFSKRMFIVSALLLLSKKIRDNNFKGFLNLFVVSVFLYIFLNDLHPTFKRLGMYYSFFEVLLLPYFIVIFKGNSKIPILLLLILYCYAKYIYGFESNWDLFFPYEHIFDDSYKFVY